MGDPRWATLGLKSAKPTFEWMADTCVHSFATLIQWLVPLLETYEHALQSGDGETRLEFADSIYQGISPDPELFLNHLDLPFGLCDTVFAPPPACRSYPFATEMVSPVRAPILPFAEF